jgi:hypothetical protein
MTFRGPGPPTSKPISIGTLVTALDPDWRRPAEIYIFPPDRKFVEVIPPASEDLGGPFYESSDGLALYSPSADGQSVFYKATG